MVFWEWEEVREMHQCYGITECFRLEGTMQFQPPSHWQGPFFVVHFPPVAIVHLQQLFLCAFLQ